MPRKLKASYQCPVRTERMRKLYPHSLYTKHVPEHPTEKEAYALMEAVQLFSPDELVEDETWPESKGCGQLEWHPLRPGCVRARVVMETGHVLFVYDDANGNLLADGNPLGTVNYRSGEVKLPPHLKSEWTYFFSSEAGAEDYRLYQISLVTEPFPRPQRG